MKADLTDLFLAALGDSGLLEPSRVAELAEWCAEAKSDPAALAQELRRRKWLSDYQIREIGRGRGQGLTVGPYRLIELLGEGGMGRVFKASHVRLDRLVALKLIRPEKLGRPKTLERFHREIRAAAQLAHPNVVLAIDADSVGGQLYFAMEFVDGTDLARLVEQSGPLDPAVAADYFRQAAAGLQHAHERGLVHRDVKPSNLLLTPRGQVKVADLGLAVLAGDAEGRVTQEGNILGTPDFLAPEQARSPLAVDGRADVYALGATLYFLLTGRIPFEGASPTEKLVMHVTAPPPSLLATRPDAPPALDAAIKQMMAKRPEERPRTPEAAARLVADALAAPEEVEAIVDDGFAFDAAPAAPPGNSPRRAKAKPGKSRWLPVAAVLGAAAFVAAGVAVGTIAFSGPAPDGPVDPAGNPAGIALVKLPGGTFMMGADAADQPQVEVTVPGPFFIGVTEVTNGQYLKIMGTSPARKPRGLRLSADIPVDSVTWDEANEFCRKLTASDESIPAGWAYRLPTEAEWEYACRAGTAGPFNGATKLVYGKGGVFNPDAPGDALGEEDVTKTRMERGFPYPAGTSAPNAFGLKDCHGNVWEWTATPFTPTHATPPHPAPPPPPGAFRTIRGGSWREPASNCTSATRRGLAPTERRDDVGFRVALAPAGE